VNGRDVLILGAHSDIAKAIAKRFAREGFGLQLAARNSNDLENLKTDLAIRYGVEVSLHEFDVLQTDRHGQFIASLPTLPTVAVCAVGFLGEQTESERDHNLATKVLRTNFEGPAALLSVLANAFETRGSGALVGISSVAGERGRASNYVYGSAKSGFTAFLSGLRNRLASSGVNVITVLPGFVATRMTSNLKLPSALTADPQHVAEDVFKAYTHQRSIVYSLWFWRGIMLVIKLIPERYFKRMNL
tara:strand:+ start:172 stop:909 length:738 start_codon:yes stop_codon:yes gene_type:complete